MFLIKMHIWSAKWSARWYKDVRYAITTLPIAFANSVIVVILSSELYKSGEFSHSGEFFRDEIVLIWHRNFSTCSSDSTNCSSKLEIYFPLSRTSFLAWYSWLFRVEISDFNSTISSSEAFSRRSISLLRS